jgi:hypothetical protein
MPEPAADYVDHVLERETKGHARAGGPARHETVLNLKAAEALARMTSRAELRSPPANFRQRDILAAG